MRKRCVFERGRQNSRIASVRWVKKFCSGRLVLALSELAMPPRWRIMQQLGMQSAIYLPKCTWIKVGQPFGGTRVLYEVGTRRRALNTSLSI